MDNLNKVKMYRIGAGLTQSDMAKKLGLSLVAYCQKETGQRPFKLEEIKKFVQVIKEYNSDITMDEIFM